MSPTRRGVMLSKQQCRDIQVCRDGGGRRQTMEKKMRNTGVSTAPITIL